MIQARVDLSPRFFFIVDFLCSYCHPLNPSVIIYVLEVKFTVEFVRLFQHMLKYVRIPKIIHVATLDLNIKSLNFSRFLYYTIVTNSQGSMHARGS